MNNKNTIDFKETEEFKEIFRNELKKDVKEFNLSSFELINFVYFTYFNDYKLFNDNSNKSFQIRELLKMSDRHDANKKENIHLINFIVNYRSIFVSDKAIEEYNLIKK